MNFLSKFTSLILVTGTLLAVPLTIQAETAPNRGTYRCDTATNKINLLTTRYGNNKDNHIKAYQNAKQRIGEFVNKLKENSYDTTRLEADLVSWDSLIKKVATEYSEFVAALNLSKDYLCGNSNGDFLDQIEKAKQELAQVRSAGQEARRYYQDVIRVDIKAIKAQKNS